ncbi:MAG: glycosyltransferase [Microgenomates group bacterium]
MYKIPTVTIGIPAFNEDQNIGTLVTSLLKQKQDGWKLESILVVSDGSTDKTCEVISAISTNHPLVQLRHRKLRKGISSTQNEILEHTSSDILVLIDADVFPANDEMISNLIGPLTDPAIGVVGGKPIPSPTAQGTIEKIMTVSEYFKNDVREHTSVISQLLLCHGRIRAFSRSFYSVLRWPENVPEDSFSYLFCIKSGFDFAYAPLATVYFHVPQNLSDYQKQNKRFDSSPKFLKRHFSPAFVDQQYSVPKFLLLKKAIHYIFKYPVYFPLYIGVYLFLKLLPIEEGQHSLSTIAVSTKRKLTHQDNF